ncbi:G2-specific serine/threonine protein kinase [Mortierella sp. GBA30]|nr:G2-specific serine/threonine protein kinase [Mortierella sp. GBA30]
MSTKEKEQLVAEVNILKDLKHPNIVEFLERVIDRENSFIYILMEYCEGGDLATVIKRHKEMSIPIGEEFVWSIMTQLVLALHECHCGVTFNEETKQQTPRPILHRDLKPDNVFLDAQKNVKLGDFGLSRSLTNPQKAFAQTYVGTPFYMSPELISESVYDTKSDIWSLGCVVFEMCALEPPFLADTQGELSAKIRVGRIPMLPAQYSQELGQVVRAMLQVNPRKRPTTTDLLNNPRIKNISMEQELNRRAARLDNVKQALVEKDAAQTSKDAEQANREKTLRTAEQTLRERETVLIAREEATHDREKRLAEYEQRLREYEQKLVEREQMLTKDRQDVDEMRKELLQGQERPHSVVRKAAMPNGLQSVEPMAIDGKAIEGPSSFFGGPAASADSTGSNGNLAKQSWTLSRNSNLFGNIKSSTATLPSTGTGTNSLNAFEGTLSTDQPPASLNASRPLPRRKTGLSVGRYSLQTSNTFRNKSTNASGSGTSGTSASALVSALDAQSSGAASTNSLNFVQRPNSVMSSSSSSHLINASAGSKLFQGQPYTYNGPTGKETRLSGRLGQVPGVNPNNVISSGAFTFSSSSIDPPRMRAAKSKSASSLAASLSSTTLSGAASSSSGATSSNNTPFMVQESSMLTASTTPSSTATSSIFSSVGKISANDPQMSGTAEVTTSQSAGSQQTRALGTQSNNGSLSSRGLLGFQSQMNATGSSSSLQLSSVDVNNYSSRRSNSSGIATSMGHARFSSVSGNNTTAGSSLPTSSAASSPPHAPTVKSSNTSVANGNNRHQRSESQGGTPPDRIVGNGNGSSNSNGRRDEDEDLRMEWDDDIPSPFIKKTYMRPQSGSGGTGLGPVPFRNLSRS